MRKFVLVLILLALVAWFASQRFSLITGRSPDGTYKIVAVDKTSGKVYKIFGK